MSFLQFDFMKNALIAILIISPLFGLMGTMIVSRKMAFFSDALGHSALTGIAIGVVLGMTNTSVSMILFAVAFALLLNYISSRYEAANDTIISVFSSCSMALGLAILSRGGNFNQYSGMLVGDILSITVNELKYLGVVFVIAVLFWAFGYNKLQAISINRSLAGSRRIPIKLFENLFAVLVAVVVTISIKWVGILIINALLILPAAASKNMSENVREYHFFAILFSLFSGLTGLVISYYTNVATGPMIVIIASVIYFMTHIYIRINRR